MLTNSILLDYQSSTPCLEKVVESMKPYWIDIFANPSSKTNLAGIHASAALESSREKISSLLGLNNKKIIFTSGATEANNLALLGFARNYVQNKGKLGNIITLSTEHKAVLEPLRQLKKEGFTITEINPDSLGILSIEKFLDALTSDTFLVSIMLANNEIGVIQPVEEIFEICKAKGIKLHTDAAQCLGYLPINLSRPIANMVTISSHKIYGPKGIGLLIVDDDILLNPLVMGGGQEYGFRSGTIPLPLIIGFTKAIELALENQDVNVNKLLIHRNNLYEGLMESNNEIIINGSITNRLPHNLNITVANVSGSLLHKKLKPKIICSSGSACSNGKTSHVLKAIGRTSYEAEASLRLSVGLETKTEEIEEAIFYITSVIKFLRK